MLNPNNLNSEVEAKNDFYEYAVGGWMRSHPIPDDYTSWNSFSEISEKNYSLLRGIIENNYTDNNKEIEIIKNFYYSGLQSKRINEESSIHLEEEFYKIDQIKTEKDLALEVARIHRRFGAPLFYFYGDTDHKNSKLNIAQLKQGGLGLPDREYYLNEDSHSLNITTKYKEHIQKMFLILGESKDSCLEKSQIIFDIETLLADASIKKEDLRDPEKNYHKMTRKELSSLSTIFDWTTYFDNTGAPNFHEINVGQPSFFEKMGEIMTGVSLDDWKIYLKWHVLKDSAIYADTKLSEENFDFYGRCLEGQKRMKPRWKTLIDFTNNFLGQALGKLYIQKNFSEEAKIRAEKMSDGLVLSMTERIANITWMEPKTKKMALKKLKSMVIRLAYPDQWIDYSQLEFTDSFWVNVARAKEFKFNREMRKINQPTDRNEWLMNPQTINAYYSPDKNEMVFPAAILQEPFFSQEYDDALNYGAIGAVIGHEMTHAFDDEGRKYDESGNLRDWWSQADQKKFQDRTEKIIKQFSSYQLLPKKNINGHLTLGENIADLGGLNIALTAFKKTEQYKNNIKIDGFTPLQRFFLSWAQVWKNNTLPEKATLCLKIDPHSPAKFRVNGPLRNINDFFEAFEIKDGDAMWLDKNKRVEIW